MTKEDLEEDNLLKQMILFLKQPCTKEV